MIHRGSPIQDKVRDEVSFDLDKFQAIYQNQKPNFPYMLILDLLMQ